MPTLFRRLPELPLTPSPIKRVQLSELEFAAPRVDLPPPPAVLDPFDEDWSVPVRARLLDPRLQKVISAAANGWVVERFE